MKINIVTEVNTYKFESSKKTLTIGRADSNDLTVPLEELSRQHCRLDCEGDEIFITDTQSKNGVYVDKQRILPDQKTKIMFSSSIKLANKYDLILISEAIENSIGRLKIEKTNSQLELTAPVRATQTKVLSPTEVRELASIRGKAEPDESDDSSAKKNILLGMLLLLALGVAWYFG